MKKLTLVMSVLSGIIAVLAVVLNIRVLFGKSLFMGFAMFSMMSNGGFMGFIGNLLGLLTTAAAFGAMSLFGFKVSLSRMSNARRPALISGMVVAAIALLSVIFSLANHKFNFGDIVMVLFPVAFMFCIIQTVEE